MRSYNARFIPNDAVPNSHRRKHFSAHSGRIPGIGIRKGQQVRVEHYAPGGRNPLDLTLCKGIDVHDYDPDAVFGSYRHLESTHHDLRGRLELSSIDPFMGKIISQVPDSNIADDDAEKQGDVVERLTDNGRHCGLISIAPNGGRFEEQTSEQVEHVGKQTSPKYISIVVCKDFNQGGSTFDDRHVSSTDISEASFPKLKTVIERHFENVFTLHGWDEDSICIGGSAPFTKLGACSSVYGTTTGGDANPCIELR